MIEVAAERGMYDFEFMGVPVTMEPGLAELESKAANVIKRIVEEERLHHDDQNERTTLACFLAVQMVRTRAVYVTQQDWMKRLEKWLRAEGAPEEFFKADPHVGTGENAEKVLLARMIHSASSDFAPALAEKDWVLLKTDLNTPYLIGDHPLAMFNHIDHSPRGNLGIKVQGIELYFPLNPTLALGMWCPSIQQTLLEGFKKLDGLSESAPEAVAPYMQAWEDGIQIVEAIRSGSTLPSRPDNITHFNSLQIATSERFLFSCNGDFALAEQMIRDNPAFKHGKRVDEATGKF
ncbi:MAG: DUF4238 domain-containing protein [Gammaproteobacteria bacterium]|nr:DUF4238 domain-containing protein [Gammaproteobacteria bacterium]